MNILPGVTRVTGDGVIGISGAPKRIYSITATSTTTAATIYVRNGATATSDIYAQIDGIAAQCVVVNWAGGLRLPAGAYLDVNEYTSYATVMFTEEF